MERRPPDVEGRSKRIWRGPDGTCVVALIPSLTSYTFKREEQVPATAKLRLDFYERAAHLLDDAGMPTVFKARLSDTCYLADYVPAPPFEVIVKNRATGSTMRKYPGLFPEGHRFNPPVVKFDFRTDPEDQPIGEDYLRAFGVDVAAFHRMARECNALLRDWLAPLELWDICLIIGLDGRGRPTLTSEVSPDCMRLRDQFGNSYDKDLFRRGATHEHLVDVWTRLLSRLAA
jgi:phosphoribosylaminoimidazole-succinocarboxamide synthase